MRPSQKSLGALPSQNIAEPAAQTHFLPALQASFLGEFNPSCLASYIVSCVLNVNISSAKRSSKSRAGFRQVGFSVSSPPSGTPTCSSCEAHPVPLSQSPSPSLYLEYRSPPTHTPDLPPQGAVSTTEGLPGRVCAFKKHPITMAAAPSPCWANGW